MAWIRDKGRATKGRRWLVVWREDKRERSRAFTYKAEAERFAREVDSALDRGETPSAIKRTPDTMPTVEEYATRWQAAQPYGPSATAQRATVVRRHIVPTFGPLPLDALTPTHIREWLAVMPGAESSRLHRFRVLSAMLGAAVDDGLIATNPCAARSVKPPRPVSRPVEVWDADTLAAVRTALPERYRLLVDLGAGLGLRQGETYGLGLHDVDLVNGMVQVRRQVRLDAHQPVYALPKGEKTREVPLPGNVADAIREHLEKFPAQPVTLPWASRDQTLDGEPTTVALLLTTRRQRPLGHRYMVTSAWKPALKAAGVPQTRANGSHVLRHTFASQLLGGGVGVAAVSKYLGHATSAITLSTYAHMLPSAEADARQVLDALLKR
ncbi:tyrosine-type recombinase/integrase [Demequina salsinemoris]|uniref:tyrosine-type recombinase/integrase n=1 Tax=Demequina salsinemoris TaxID=577470 RepID=UPI0007807AFB|nr:tyrosine-type recombinase/integrase [Demequina salsinemoris]